MSSPPKAAPQLAPPAAPQSATAPRSPLLTAPIFASVLRLAWPGVVLVMFQTAVSIADMHFVGRLGTAPLAGLALVFPFVVMLQMFSAGAIGGGVSSAIARALGSGDKQRAEALLAHALVLGIGLGCGFALFMLLAGPPVYRLLGGRVEVLDAAITYSTILFAGSPSVWVANFCANALRGQGDTLKPSLMLSCAALIHIPLTAWLTLRIGIAGTAWAYVIAFSAGALLLVVMLLRGVGALRLQFAGMHWQRRHFADILGVGLVSSLSALQTVLAALVLTGVVARFGTDALAGYGVGVRLELLLVPLTFAIGAALVPLVGLNIGAGYPLRAKRIAWTGAAFASVFAGVIGIVIAALPHLWLDLFTREAAVAEAGARYLRTVAPFYAFVGLAVALYFASQGARRVGWPVFAGTIRLGLAAGGGWLAAQNGFGIGGVFVLIACGIAAWGLVTAVAVWRTPWPGGAPAGHATGPAA